MYRTSRRAVTLSLLALLAACGKPESKFKRYEGPAITQVVMKKGERRLYLISGETVVRSYDIGLGNVPVGHKQFEGDGKTPEGIYFIDRFNPKSKYYLSVGISYPRPQDTAYAAQFGKKPGGDIFIHGRGPIGNQIADKKRDWTAGCIAVKDEEIEEIYAMVPLGTPIIIYP